MGPQRKPFPRSLLLILAVLALGLAAVGSLYVRAQQNALLREEGETLDSIAVLKVHEMSGWPNDRLAETNAIAANSLFNEQLRPILEGQAGSSADQVREWMQALLRADRECTRVELVAADGTVRMSVPPSEQTVGRALQRSLAFRSISAESQAQVRIRTGEGLMREGGLAWVWAPRS